MDNVRQKATGGGNILLNNSTAQDIHIGDVLTSSQFFEPNLESFKPGNWVDSPMALDLVQHLVDSHLLILAGDFDDKANCARHLAYLLRERLQTEELRIRVRERCRSKDPQQIETAFQSKGAVILLLLEVTDRQIVDYSPSKLRGLLRQNQSYAIITTEGSRADWGIDEAGLNAQLWWELSWQTYYHRDLLVEFFNAQIARADCSLPDGVLPETSGEPLLIKGIPLATVVQQLKIPSRVQSFSEWLLKAERPVTAKAVKEQLAYLEGDPDAIVHWYRQFEPSEQLLVLGLTLFDGLPDDLLFTALELLVGKIWRSSDPGLRQYDYRDLSKFSAYFKQNKSEEGFFRVQCDSTRRRRHFLALAWGSQRRRLLAALPALTQLIRVSAAHTEPEHMEVPIPLQSPGISKAMESERYGKSERDDRELYLTESRTFQLHQILVESLSLIGLLSADVIEPYLLELVTDPAESVQKFAAKALAAWRDESQEKKLFPLLKRWWRAANDYEQDHALLGHISLPGQDHRSALRAGIALTVGYASRFDRSNRLAPDLYDFLKGLVEDKDPKVLKVMRDWTIPLVVAGHFRQLEPLLRTRVLKSDGMVDAFAQGASVACFLRPEESLSLLDGWRAAVKADRRQSTPLDKERLLAAVALTYGYLPCDDFRSLLSPEAIGARLRSMLAEEADRYVRHYIFNAIELQAVRNFELVSLILQDLLSHIALPDRPAAIKVFVRTYLHQRQRLPGGDERIEVSGSTYGVWLGSTRPLTEIEASLYSWLLDDARPIAQQLAVDIFAEMNDTLFEQEERRLQQFRDLNPYIPTSPPRREISTEASPTLNSLPLLGHMAVVLATPRKQRVRAILRFLLAEMLIVQDRGAPRESGSSTVDPPRILSDPRTRAKAIVERWAGVANDTTKAIACHLEQALTFYRWRWAIVFSVLLAFLLAASGARALYSRLTQPSPPFEEVRPNSALRDPTLENTFFKEVLQ